MRNPTPRNTSVDLSSSEMAAIEKYATDRGITIEQAATQLARAELSARFGRPMKAGARVVPFRRR